MTLERKKLAQYLEDYLPDFYDMKKVGFFEKGTRKTDYEKIAERYCSRLGLKSIYEYKFVCRGAACDGINCQRDHPLCPSHPVGKWNPIKWEPFAIEDEKRAFPETDFN